MYRTPTDGGEGARSEDDGFDRVIPAQVPITEPGDVTWEYSVTHSQYEEKTDLFFRPANEATREPCHDGSQSGGRKPEKQYRGASSHHDCEVLGPEDFREDELTG